jgi:xylan 1,4-beta-xylosidase
MGTATSLGTVIRTAIERDRSSHQTFDMTRSTSRALSAALLIVVCAAVAGAQPPSSAVARFDWFTYEGHDPVFNERVPGSREYQNPILAGFYPDPSIMRDGDDYYLVNSSFSYYPGVPIFHSKDLVNWTQIGHVLDRPSQLALDSAGISRGIFAPSISAHEGTFYMITTIADRGNFFVAATDPAGPWSEPIWLPELNGLDGYDPSFFFDDDGRAYIVNNGPPNGAPLYNGHRAIWVQEFDVATKRMKGPRSIIVNGGVSLAAKPVWIEAPHIIKHDGKYFLICAEGGTADQHSEVVFRSDAPMGPYTPGPVNPILTQRHLDNSRPFPVTSTGHADFVETQRGDWWAVFLGTRPYGDNLYNTGRETFLLPVRWENGWPVILTGNRIVPYVARRPHLPWQPAPAVPRTGNFTVRDEFNGQTLAPYWNFVRTPRDSFYDLNSAPGSLTLRARSARLGTRTQLSFVGRRQQHVYASASTVVRYAPAHESDAAGLVAFQTDDFYYFLGVALAEGRPVIQLAKRAGALTNNAEIVVASQPLATRPGAPVYLKIVARGGRYDFYYSTSANSWTPLQLGADGTILSTKLAGGFSSNFVGAMFGMYAYSAGQ